MSTQDEEDDNMSDDGIERQVGWAKVRKIFISKHRGTPKEKNDRYGATLSSWAGEDSSDFPLGGSGSVRSQLLSDEAKTPDKSLSDKTDGAVPNEKESKELDTDSGAVVDSEYSDTSVTADEEDESDSTGGQISAKALSAMLAQLSTMTEAVKTNNQLMSLMLQGGSQRSHASEWSMRNSVFPSQSVAKKEENSYKHMQSVKVKIVFANITDIDTVGQHFDAEVYIQARWTEPQLRGKTEDELDQLPFDECWNPKLKILNLYSGLEKDRLSIMVRYEDQQVEPVVTYMWHVKAVFMERLELEHFPFDVQELSVVLSSDRPLDEIDLVPDVNNISNVSSNAVKDNQEWKSFRHVEFAQDFRNTDFYSSSMHPVLVASCHVNRQLGFYIWNIFIIVLLILCLSLTVLSIDPTGTDRLGVTMTLFLTCVAFKIVVKTTLPNISYLTYMDVYVLFTMMYLMVQAAENAIISHVARSRDRREVLVYDEIAQSILIALLLLFHAVFLIYIQLTAFNRRRLMGDKERAFHLNLASHSRKSYAKAAKTDLSKLE